MSTVHLYAGLTFFIDASFFCLLMFALVISEIFKTPSSEDELFVKKNESDDVNEGVSKAPFFRTYGTIAAEMKEEF